MSRLCPAEILGKTPETLRIYDPYFCDGPLGDAGWAVPQDDSASLTGAVQRNLGELGFTQVYNRNEDFYQAASDAGCDAG